MSAENPSAHVNQTGRPVSMSAACLRSATTSSSSSTVPASASAAASISSNLSQADKRRTRTL